MSHGEAQLPADRKVAIKCSREMRAAISLKAFSEPVWSSNRVLTWITYRKPDRLESSWGGAILYHNAEDPRPLLLHALQLGKIRAILRGEFVLPQKWANRTAQELTDARFYQRDVLALWPTDIDAQKKKRPKVGRTPSLDWNMVRVEMRRLMDYHGDFQSADPEWNAQARLEKKLLAYCSKIFKREPAPSTIRHYLKNWLVEWKKQKSCS
jgi:hypothetical protein